MGRSRKRVVELVFVAAAFLALGLSGSAQLAGSAAACNWQRHDLKLRFGEAVNATAATGPNSVWLGGENVPRRGSAKPILPLLVHWDGRRFSRTPVRIAWAGVGAMDASSPSDVWAVGSIRQITDGSDHPLALHWNGSKWVRRAVPRTGVGDVAAISPRNAWAVGGVRDFPWMEHWNGRGWRRVALPIPPQTRGFLTAISASSSSDIWVVGAVHPPGLSEERQPAAFHWDGARWRAATLPPVPISGFLEDVAALSPSSAWAVGSSSFYNGQDLDDGPYNIRFDGERWSSVPGVEEDFQGVSVPVRFDGVIARPNQAWAWVNDIHPMLAHWEGGEWRVGPELPWPTHQHLTAYNGSRNDFWVETRTFGPHFDVERLAHYDCHT